MGIGLLFTCFLVLDISFSSSLNICSPCNQKNPVVSNVTLGATCNHKVSIDAIKTGINFVIQKLSFRTKVLKRNFGYVKVPYQNPPNVRVMYPFCGFRRRIKRKVRFIHETYANLTLVYEVLETVSIPHEADVIPASSLQPIMCSLYQANRNLHCSKTARKKKGKMKRRKKIKKFKTTKDCRIRRKRFRYSKRNHPEPGEKDLLKLRVAQQILQETLFFWETYVVEKNGTLMLKQNAEDQTNVQRIMRCKRRKYRRRDILAKYSMKQRHSYYLNFIVS
ncbi:uncharacterized protein LOC134232173 [Saccostrea cucullata]|uniref:uncharacterized protein LOC134232173 n=1 Tax=Saccostrea cuccullata TaxID=36930 RepID=UPI002ED6422B